MPWREMDTPRLAVVWERGQLVSIIPGRLKRANSDVQLHLGKIQGPVFNAGAWLTPMCRAASRVSTASRRLDQPRCSTLRVAHRAKQATFELEEYLGSCEETISAWIAHNDTRLLRSHLDDVTIGHYTALYSPRETYNRFEVASFPI
jgi:hypothetical protein